jgi:hypothetical protein
MATGGPAVHLLPGAGDEPPRLGPLIRPPIELHWTRMIAEINGVAQAEPALHRHLSGSGRVIPPKVLRDGIAALQDNWCFYCRGLSALPLRQITSSRGSAAVAPGCSPAPPDQNEPLMPGAG